MVFKSRLLVSLFTALMALGLSYWGLSPWQIAAATLVGVYGSLQILNRITARPNQKIHQQIDSAADQAALSISQSVSKIAIDGANLSHFLDGIGVLIRQQGEHSAQIANKVETMEQATDQISALVAGTQTQVESSVESLLSGQRLLTNLVAQKSQLETNIATTESHLADLSHKTETIGEITSVINTVAEQTNLLALNAAIEAARAGDHGRGFSVVADEVRTLANKTAEATGDISKVLTEIVANSQSSNDAMIDVKRAAADIAQDIETLSSDVTDIVNLMQQTKSNMEESSNQLQAFRESNKGITDNINSIHASFGQFETELDDGSSRVMLLSEVTEGVFRDLNVFNFEDENTVIRDVALAAAKEIGVLFEDAILDGQLTEQALFDFNYTPIANTNPEKVNSAFDAFTDRVLPAIQEPILERHREIIYAGAVDKNGYFPTHNKKFSQTLTGNYETDLANNRTKRIFTDRTGSRCGSNTKNFLIQTYKRDTGEVMHDLSAPIFVNGNHWGGFRIGYKA